MLDETGFPDATAGARHPIVLIVEDEPLLRCTTAEFLCLSGYTVLETPSAAEAVTLFDSGKSVDVVFCDVCVSGPTDGLMLARWLEQRHPHVPVMLTSGYGGAVREAALEIVGSEGFLSKPYHQDELVRRIRSLIW